MVELLAQILALLQSIIIQPLIWVFPVKWIIVYPGEAGVRYTCGKPGKRLDEGFHFSTSCQVLKKKHINTVLIVTDAVSLLTQDSVALRVDAVVTYSIRDLPVYRASSEFPMSHLAAVAEASLRTSISTHTFDEVATSSGEIEEEMRKQIVDATKGCGIRLKNVRFQNIRHEDPHTRMMQSIPAIAESLTRAAQEVAKNLNVSDQVALMSLSQNIQPVIEMGLIDQPDIADEES